MAGKNRRTMTKMIRRLPSRSAAGPARVMGFMSTALITMLLVAIYPGDGRAKTAVLVPLAKLGISDEDGDKVERWVRAALATLPDFRWVGQSRLDKIYHQPKYARCENQPSCLAALGRAVGADVIVAGGIGSLGGAYMVYLRLIGADGRTLESANEILDPHATGLRDRARALAYRLLLPRKYHGTLVVNVDVNNAWIYLDGRRIGRSPAGRFSDITVGTHALRVTHESYRDYVRFVKVEFDQVMTIPVSLSAFPVRSEEMRLVDSESQRPLSSQELPWYRRWWVVATVGAVIFAGAATTTAIIARSSVPRDVDGVVRP